MKTPRRIVIKLSGESLSASSSDIIDKKTLEGTVSVIKQVLKENVAPLIVIGAGNICRGELIASSDTIDRVTADHMGMLGTVINAIALENALKREGIKAKAFSSVAIEAFLETYEVNKVKKYLDEGYVVISGGGLGKPFYSTDTSSVLKAIDIGASLILMAKNGVEGVYDKDPRTNEDAKLIKEITPQEIVDKKLKVMDLSAAEILCKHDINVRVFNNHDLENFTRVLRGLDIGTTIRRK